MAKFFTVPDKEKEYQSYMVFALTIIWSSVTAVTVSMGFYFLPHIWYRWAILLGASLLTGAFNLTLNRLGYVRFASWSLTVMIWLYITVPAYSAGGIMAPSMISQVCVILTAGFLLGWRGGLAVGLLTIVVDFWFAYLEMTGKLPYPSVVHTPLTRWVGTAIPFGTILALQYYATNHLRVSLVAMQREILKSEKAEKIKDKTMYALGERVKELKTLYAISRILQDEDPVPDKQFREIVNAVPPGWQYPDITSACIAIGAAEYCTPNYKPSEYYQQAEMYTTKGTKVSVLVAYAHEMPEMDEGPFLKEERNLIMALVEILKTDLERRERKTELKDYRYALDIASIVSISGVDGAFTFVNENFCKASKYSREELLGKDFGLLWSGIHSPEYLAAPQIAMQDGKPYGGEFCNRAKDGTLYWVDATIVPFMDETGDIYQYLTINHDITERKQAEENIKQSELLLKKITSQVPGNTYMFEINKSGEVEVLFMSRGTDDLDHAYDIKDVPESNGLSKEKLHDDDRVKFNSVMKEAAETQSPISFQYRVIINGNVRWRWMQAVSEKDNTGKILWYGSTSDITPLVEYIASVEQIIFDIGHVIRRPISTMLGMTKLINDGNLSEKEMKEMSESLHAVSQEMDKFIRELNLAYSDKRGKTQHNIDVSSLLNTRSSLFE